VAKLLQLSILIAMLAIPAIAAKHQDPVKGLKQALVHSIWFNLLYAFILFFVYGRFAS
jgi:hypothetical protein